MTITANGSAIAGLDPRPHDLGAEQCALGGMMLSSDAISDVTGIIRSLDYHRPAHQVIHEAILDMFGRGAPVDVETVKDELARRGETGVLGERGPLYLADLVASVPTAASAGYYAGIVREHAILREVGAVGLRLQQWSVTRPGTGEEIADRAAAEVLAITEGRDGEEMRSAAEIMPGTLDMIEAVGRDGLRTGVPTGFADLDRLTNGFQPGQMIVVAARPAIGKSTLARDFARSAAVKHGLATAIFSLEMGRDEIMMDLLSAAARVQLQKLKAGGMTDDDWARLGDRMSEVADAPLFIDDSPTITMASIRSKCRRLRHRHDLRLVIIDYMQLMSSAHRAENRQQEVSDMSRAMKLLAKELEVPVVALSQLNRGPEMRSDKKPFLADLRESGSIEQDADMVILLHREDAYDPDSPRAGEADLIVAKHRNGPTATISVAFQGHYSRFVDMAPGSPS